MHDTRPRPACANLHIYVVILASLAVIAPSGSAVAAVRSQASRAAAAQTTSRLTVTLPQDDAELEIDGKIVPGEGSPRVVQIPVLRPGMTLRYTLTARWDPNTYTKMTRTKIVTLRAGEPLTVDLSVDDPTDRVRVIYVPTPDDVGQEMVRLAGVKPGDVVYEPGCGDARITIAAVKAGAARGVCIDIDPERAAESRTRVKEAGFADRIDVRLGDALDMKDLTDVTVVFLYMGDHFDNLIKPVLWKQLPVGARIVSHRFTMGDWKPDKTITVSSVEGGEFELHLWTITEELKRK
jgi:uncharacterized protein (TIGR03000 family)